MEDIIFDKVKPDKQYYAVVLVVVAVINIHKQTFIIFIFFYYEYELSCVFCIL